MEAIVQYMIPVTVTVNVADRTVVRVLQENENMTLSEPFQVWDEKWIPVLDEVLIEDAIDIAENNAWPAWDQA